MSIVKGGLAITLDPHEVKEFFTDLRSWDSERDTEDPRLRGLNYEQRLDFPKYLPVMDLILLDAGCGDGRITYEIATLGASHVVGVDISHYVLMRARERLSGEETFSHFIQCDLDRLPFKSSSFNAATCLDTLVHIPNPRKALIELSTVLVSGGFLAVNATNRNAFWRITVQNNKSRFLRDVFLYRFPSFLVNPVLKVLGKKMIGRHMSEDEFRLYIEDSLKIVKVIKYGGSPPVYFMAIALKPMENGE